MKTIFLAVFLLLIFFTSCTSRPSARHLTEDEIRLDRVAQEVKTSHRLIEKYFEPRDGGAYGYSIRGAEAIILKSELQREGRTFEVTYNIHDAVPVSEDRYQIPFMVHDLSNGRTRDDILVWSPEENGDTGLLLSFDDAYLDSWQGHFDLFDAHGASVTFFVQGEIENEEIAAFCSAVLDRGFGLGFHTVNHLDLRRVPREIFYFETIEAAAAFYKAGIRFSALAYPFGFSESWMHEVLILVYPFTRGYGTNIRFYTREALGNGYFVSTAIDNIIHPDEEKYKDFIFRILFAAKFAGNYIVPITSHEISDEAQWGIGPDRLEYLLETANRLKVKFYTYSDIR